jgi:hypothetical protein
MKELLQSLVSERFDHRINVTQRVTKCNDSKCPFRSVSF